VNWRNFRVQSEAALGMKRPRDIFEIHRQDGFDRAYGRLWNIFRHELNIKRA